MMRLIDPSEKQAVALDWSDWLGGGATIENSLWSATPAAFESGSAVNAAKTETSVFLSGCLLGEIYRLVNTVTTSTGEIGERAVILRCSER